MPSLYGWLLANEVCNLTRNANSGLTCSLRARRRFRLGACGLIALWLVFMGAPIPHAMAAAASPLGVWLMGTQVAIQMFNCRGALCGRVIWLKAPLDPNGLLKRDKNNPDPALRQRQVCGPTIVWKLRLAAPNRWVGGMFYNADDGQTYNASMVLKSEDMMVARIYSGSSIFGVNRTLIRVPKGTSAGWC